jgi:DNA-directed RNA polymerase specialized sigma24 family protein
VERYDALIIKAAGGDRRAAAELIGCVWPDAYRIAWSILQDRCAAEDAAQEACARAWGGLGGLRRHERFAVWFYRIVVNESRRIQQRTRCGAPLVDDAAVDGIGLDDRIAVRAAIAGLKPHLRLLVVLRYYYLLRSAEIARILGASPVTIRWQMMIAHRQLRNALDDHSTGSHSKRPSEGRYADESIAAS